MFKQRNSICGSCSKSGRNNNSFGKTFWLGRHHTEETKIKISNSQKGNKGFWFGKTGFWKGKTRSAEYRRRQSEARRIYSEESLYSRRRQKNHFYKWLKGGTNGFERYIGLSLEEFKLWISRNFEKEMSWNNHGRTVWHIDHKKPMSFFDLTNEEQVKQAWNFTNLQPLTAKKNLSKGHKIL